MNYTILFFISLAATLLITPYLKSVLFKNNILDKPGGRKTHLRVIPRMGGITIITVAFFILALHSRVNREFILIALSFLPIFICGILDDLYEVSSKKKLLFQIVSAVILIYYLSGLYTNFVFFGIEIAHPYDYYLLFFFIIGVINSINLMDGMDGLATGCGLQMFAAILIFSFINNDSTIIILTTCICGGLLGFLKFNSHPASIFLGDTGSLNLGFFLVLTALLTSLHINPGTMDLTFATILIGFPIIDTIRLIFVRIRSGRSPMSPDRNHLHHLLLDLKIREEYIVFVLESVTLLFILFAFGYVYGYRDLTIVVFVLLSTSILSIKAIIRKSSNITNLYDKLKWIGNFPHTHLIEYKSILISIANILVFLILLSSFPTRTSLPSNELLAFILVAISFLLLNVMQLKTNKNITNIYVFINLTLFFTISKISFPIKGLIPPDFFNIDKFYLYSFILLAAILLVLAMARFRILFAKSFIFSEMEITIINLILLTVVVKPLDDTGFLEILSYSLIKAFFIYIWYKVLINLNVERKNYLSFGSFLIPISPLLYLYLI